MTAGVSLAFLWLAATAGALSLLTPCVFPMVPITVSYFVRRELESRGATLATVAAFGVGIVAAFTALGVFVAALLGATGLVRLAANPWVNLAIAVLFVVLALNLLGLYTVSLPSSLLTRLDGSARSQRSRVAGALLMGVLFTLTSFTCTAPFIGTLLVAASQGEWQRPLAGMFVYSLVFALPFIALSSAPSLIARLPSGGAWLGRTKAVMGFIELAAAVKFLSNADLVWGWNVVTHDVVLASWTLLCLVITFYLLGAFRLPHEPSAPQGVEPSKSARRKLPDIGGARAASAFGFLVAGMWLATGLSGRPLGVLESYLPPVDGAVPAVDASLVPVDLQWRLNDLQGALLLARDTKRNVFIDFTGYTCTNCRWMEANMFTRPEIKVAMSHFVLARLYTDGDGAIYERQQTFQQMHFGTIALPLYAVVKPNGDIVTTLAGLTRSPRDFLKFLSEGEVE